MRAILEIVSPAVLAQALEPLRADPAHAAVLLDIDGTLAPIVRHAEDAHVNEATRALLIEISKRYGLVGCISGRRAATARRIVAIGSISYVGNHGGELLRAGASTVELLPEVEGFSERIRQFSLAAYTSEHERLRVRAEDKHSIAAFHWRGAPDEDAAAKAVREIASRAEDEGLAVHWGRKVLEVRPPVTLHKGIGVNALLDGQPIQTAMYAGDDSTDLDAFNALRQRSELRCVVCVAISSREAPAQLTEQADLIVDDQSSVRELLQALL